MDVYLPMSAQVLVSIGEKTTGVETVIARLGEPVAQPVQETEPAAEEKPAEAEAAAVAEEKTEAKAE